MARSHYRVSQIYPGRKIDAHTHIGKFGSWADVSCTEEELIERMTAYNVEKSCVYYMDNKLVRKAVKKYPKKLVGVVWPNPYEQDSVMLVRMAISDWGFKGIKLHPLFHAFLPNDAVVHPIMEEARKMKVPILIHSGHPPFSLPWSIGELAEEFPDVTIVMLHMGHAHGVYIQAAINTARKFSNIYLETSGVSMHSKIREATLVVGEDRVMYGSDIPFHDPSVEMGKIASAGLSEKQLEKIFYLNAKNVLKL